MVTADGRERWQPCSSPDPACLSRSPCRAPLCSLQEPGWGQLSLCPLASHAQGTPWAQSQPWRELSVTLAWGAGGLDPGVCAFHIRVPSTVTSRVDPEKRGVSRLSKRPGASRAWGTPGRVCWRLVVAHAHADLGLWAPLSLGGWSHPLPCDPTGEAADQVTLPLWPPPMSSAHPTPIARPVPSSRSRRGLRSHSPAGATVQEADTGGAWSPGSRCHPGGTGGD